MSSERTFLGHPRGLATLFFTEMWERFSYYGGRAMLVLYMVSTVNGDNPGFGMTAMQAGALYALYVSLAYLTNLPGGWISDQFLGARKSVLYGGILIAIGNLIIASALSFTIFVIGLSFIAIGTGLLKPNVSTMVGSLYKTGDVKRDSAFQIFYMGINLGALLAPLIAGYFGETVNWRLGFMIVGIGMILGLVQYVLGAKHLGDAGLYVRPDDEETVKKQRKSLRNAFMWLVVAILLLLTVHFTGIFPITVISLSNVVGVIFVIVPFAYFGVLFSKNDFSTQERNRVIAIIVLYLAATLFWSAFEQAGSTLTLFADRYTRNNLFGFAFPVTWWQSVNALWIIVLTPVFAWLWIFLKKKDIHLSIPLKFSIGLFMVGVGFLVLVPPAMKLVEGSIDKVGVMWLLSVYFIHTIGELFLSPVGLSAMTKLAPERIVGQMMGVWFLGAATGNYIGGRIGGLFETFPIDTIFLSVFGTSFFAALIMFVLIPWMKRMIGDIE
ncbi:MAG: oligopeptide:H+ symporter [Cyclobacteriaceae bacterium]|nr:oligopeptide:H+ symporter [Cyclobacteriaceae bacterium]